MARNIVYELNQSAPAANAVQMGTLLAELVAAVNTLRTDHNALATKLNADAGVTDANYAQSGIAAPLKSLPDRVQNYS